MFFQFLCYFIDVIIAMAMFAFFFPLSLVTTAFKESADVPYWLSWIKSLGKGVGVEQIKNMVTEHLMQLLDIRNDLEMAVSSVHAAQLRSYLKVLDLLEECRIEKPNWGGTSSYDIFTQPGMRYSQAKALVEAVLLDDKFGSLPKAAREYAIAQTLV